MSELHLSKSLLTIALKRNYTFISAFPGFFVFGDVKNTFFYDVHSFQFSHFELPKLYSCFLKITNFFSNDTQIQQQDIILNKSSITFDKDDIYFWVGRIINKNGNNLKVISFGIEREQENVFEFNFTENEFNSLLQSLPSIIFSCICLKPIEKYILNN